MATENVGGIQYTVDADTAAMIKAEAVVNKSIAKQVAQFEKADQAVRDYITTQKEMGRTINQMGQVMDKNGNVVVASTMQYRKLAEQAGKSFNAVSKDVTKSAGAVNRALTSNLGQAGIQVQQFVGQLQGGQSAMVALAQQSADLGIVLGAPLIGVVVSLAAVLAGTLAPAVFGSVSNIEKLEKAIENTKAIMTLGKNGIIEYTDEMKRLETASENLAKIKVALAITENTKALKDSRKEFINLRADLFGFQEDSSEAAKRLTGLTDKTQDVLGLAQALQSFSNAVTDDDKLKQLSAAEEILLNMRNDKGEFPTKDLSEFAQEFFTLSDSTRQAITNNKALKGAVDELNTSAGESEEKFKQLRVGLKEQTIALRDGERSAFKYALLMSGDYSAAQIEAALKIYDTNAALKAQKEDAEESAATLKKVNDELDAFFDNESRRSTEKDAQQTATLTRQVQSVGLTPEEEIQAQYERELELLQQAQEKEVEIRGTYSERIKQIETEKNQRLKSLREQEAKNSESFLSTYGDALNSINGLFGSYVNSMDKDTKKSFEKWKKFATAQALVSTLLAVSNALATPAPWPIPLIMAGVAGAAGALNVAQIRSQSFDGAREFGGPVTAGKSYLVGERGPEMFTPNTSGGITSNKDMNGGQPTVNIYNVPSSMGQPEVTMDKVNNAIEVRFRAEGSKLASGRGPIASGMKKGAGTQFNGAN